MKDRNASFHGDIEQYDVYLSHPSRDFGVTDEALRIRTEEGSRTLYYKGPKLDKDTKTREEISTQVSDPASMDLILERLGFKKVGVVQKHRRTYILNDIEVCLDHVKDLGNFIELEIQGKDLAEGKAKILQMMEELGLKKNERRSYLELIIEKKKSAQI